MLDRAEVAAEMSRLSHLIDGGITLLRDQPRAVAEAEAVYRKAKAEAWVQVKAATSGEKITAAELSARVDAATADLRRERDIAAGLEKALYEAARSRRAQISALQSLLAAEREEAAFARTGPEMAA